MAPPRTQEQIALEENNATKWCQQIGIKTNGLPKSVLITIYGTMMRIADLEATVKSLEYHVRKLSGIPEHEGL